MTWQEALEKVVSTTKHQRFRALCSDENPDHEQREATRELMRKMAGDTSTLRPKPTETMRRLERAKACRYLDRSCACEWGTCRLKGRKIWGIDCLECPLSE